MPMSEVKLRAIARAHIRNSANWIGSEIANDREDNMEYYLGGIPGLESLDGRSQVVSSDVQDVVESVMPDMMEIFAGGDEAVRFEPVGPGDEDDADEATQVCNHVWYKENDGYGVTHDWLKDALLQKNGFIKLWADEEEEKTKHVMQGLYIDDLDVLQNDASVEILQVAPAGELANMEELVQRGINPADFYDVEIERTDTRRKIRVMGLAPEDFIISRRSIDLDTAPLLCHQDRTTATELKERGFDPDIVDKLPGYDEHQFNRERISRWRDEDQWYGRVSVEDQAMREIWIYECHLMVDYEETGIAKRYKIFLAGDGYKILPDPDTGELAVEEADHPFVSLTPIRMPHKFFGRALADLVIDVMKIKTVLWRQWLDNLYNINNARTIINDSIDMDDMLTNRVSSVVRMDGDGDVRTAAMPLAPQPIGQIIAPAMEFMDKVKEDRIGIPAVNQGLDPSALHDTATGINLVLGRAQKRILFIARTFAETGFKQAFKKLHALIVENADRAYTLRLRGKWADIDPRSWNSKMDVSVTVGLGYGTKETQVGLMEALLQKQLTVAQVQQGTDGPFLTKDDIFQALSQWTKLALGEKDNERYWTDPGNPENKQQQQQPQQDPAVLEAQAKMQLEQQKAQGQQQLAQAKLQGEMQRDQAKMAMDTQKVEAEIALQREELLHNMQLAREEMNAKLQLERDKAAGELGVKRETAQGDLEIKASEAEQRLTLQAQAQSETQNSERERAAKEGNGGDKLPAINVNIDNVPKGPKNIKLTRDDDGALDGATVD